MIVEYLLAVFLFGLEAERPPSIVSPHPTIESCNRARTATAEEIKAAGVEKEAYAVCLKVIRGGGSPA